MVAPPNPDGAVRASNQGVHFVLGEVSDKSPVGPLGWDSEYALYKSSVFRVKVGSKAKQGPYSGQTCVAGADADTPLVFQVREEGPDHGSIDIGNVQVVRRRIGLLVDEAEQQTDSVSIGGHRVRTGLALSDEPFREERLEQRGEPAHRGTFQPSSRRSAASSKSSGTPERYQ